MSSFVSDLDAPLLKLTTKDSFTLRDACNGVPVFGAIGSGKTSREGARRYVLMLGHGLERT